MLFFVHVCVCVVNRTTLVVSAVTVGAVASVIAVFGRDRVWQCLTQTLPNAMQRPLNKVMSAARAAGAFVTSLFRKYTGQTPQPSPTTSSTATTAASVLSFRGNRHK